MKKLKFICIGALLACFALNGCKKENFVRTETWTVASEKRFVMGEGLFHSLVVKESPKAEWSYLYGSIEGFDWEEGYEYVVRVNKYKVPDPPMDASSVRYTLNKIISKEKKDSVGLPEGLDPEDYLNP